MEQYTFFFGGPFSQWFDANFTVDGVTYNTAEQYMMAAKARVFGDHLVLERIMDTRSPREQKKLGRQVANFDVAKWNAVSRDEVYKANYAKFMQNPGLRDELLATRPTLLVEASPTDCLWGIGLSADDPDALDSSKWRGVNWLGEVLTKVREDIAKGVRTYKDFGWSDSVHTYDQPPRI